MGRGGLKMREKSSEIWVGIFVVVGILLLILLTMKVEKFQIGEEAGYPISIYFDSAAGLDKSASVRVAGVHVGHVEKVILEKGKARVTFRLPSDIVVYRDAKAYLKSEGFLGEKYVEITQGTPEALKVEPNGVIEQGAPPVDVEQVLSKMSGLGDDIKDVVGPVKDLVKSVDPKKIEGMIANLDKFSSQLEGIAKDSKETIQKAKDAFSSMEDIGEKVKRGEGTLGKLISDDSMYQDVKKTVENLKNISETVERGEGTLGKLVKDESLYNEAKETLQSVKGITEKVEKGEGTLGKLLGDDQLIKEAEKTMKKIQKAAESIEEQTPITVLGTLIGIFF
jgi:phospholipid/cholesterol/gamma-HCH transport system substrate-binding protein